MLLTLLRNAGKAIVNASEEASGGIMATIARVRESVKHQSEHEAQIEADRLASIADENARIEQQEADNERRKLAEDRYIAEIAAQGAEIRRRELGRSTNVLEFKPVGNVKPDDRDTEVAASGMRPAISVRDASEKAAPLDDDNLALIMILLEAA